MKTRIISASAAPYDGYELEVMLESISRVGFKHVEPAFIVGYTEPFDESSFTSKYAQEWRRAKANAGLNCIAMSSHIDLSLNDAVDLFRRRMEFASSIGAKVIISNTGPAARKSQFLQNIEDLVVYAEELDIAIALENPGDGSDSIFNVAGDGLSLLREINSKYLGLNYDAANTASHRPQLQHFASDAIAALPGSIYAHIKDVSRTDSGWHFMPIGEGDVDCKTLVHAFTNWPDLPFSIELPLRLYRDSTCRPVRSHEKVDLRKIEVCLAKSLMVVQEALQTAA